MRENLIVSDRGQITLPATMRKKLGIKPGGIITVEDRDGEIVLRPAVVMEIDTYSDAEIDRWQQQDQLEQGERAAVTKRLGRTPR
ncbi:MAG: AbrB/MazE/SpoVT family DNA-binding domain-containing protein [Gammaproteobacteria bacterium]|nr:AbrB/MazE/SpoVT family DNA-binding domain-containing protein [Gammaproteobacteria bacterium]